MSRPEGWNRIAELELVAHPTGLLALCANSPSNLYVTGLSISEVFENFAKFIKDCEELGKPFEAFAGFKL